MKSSMNIPRLLGRSTLMLLIACFIAGSFTQVNAQSKLRTRLRGSYEKLSTNERRISVALMKGSGRTLGMVPGAEIQLTVLDQGNELELTSLTTNEDGEAVLYIEAGYVFPKDEEGFSIVNANYIGNDTLRATSREIKFKDLMIDLSFEIADSIKHVIVSTYEVDSAGENVPVKDIRLNLGVERLYSTYYIESIETNEEGIAELDFPDDIPGDSLGNILVLAKLDDDDDYGTVTKSKEVNWGTIVDYTVQVHHRSLFGDEAPLWMIISVSIILAGALYNFFRAVKRIINMRNAGLG